MALSTWPNATSRHYDTALIPQFLHNGTNFFLVRIDDLTFCLWWNKRLKLICTFWEGHKILLNLHRRFVLCSASQIYVGDFAKFCDLLRIYELYVIWRIFHLVIKYRATYKSRELATTCMVSGSWAIIWKQFARFRIYQSLKNIFVSI